MSDLYAIGYPNLVAAEQVVDVLTKLQAEHAIEIEDAVIVERRGGDKVKLHRAGRGKSGWGGMVGHVFFGSGRGTADSGIDEAFSRELGAQLDAGNVALILLVASANVEKVVNELHGQYNGHVLQTSLDQQTETEFRAAAEQAHAAHVGLFN
jgi:uncharacterized membrane protein